MVWILSILILGAAFFLFRGKTSLSSSEKLETPLERLQTRYVNGEISEEEFLHKKSVLEKKK